MLYRMGIDTGGTYTDAVLVDENKAVVATSKSVTTRQDLSIGIANALAKLPKNMLQNIELVSLSTTLTTNSVVEGRGAEVCALLVGYHAKQLQKNAILDLVTESGAVLLAGGHDAVGNEKCRLDEDAARRAILKFKDSVSAFAISSVFATRNSSHELRLRALVEELTGKPVACGHELASSLGAPQRALTAVLNARMIPYIQQLISSMIKILARHKITAPLMIVKGDGSLVNIDTALQQPVATVLSGPAASVIGACALSGLKNAIVADMGGTTTDIAIITNGQPQLSADGARVGDWQPMVEAVKVFCIGLGGDSEISIKGANVLCLGPRRVVPLCLLADQYPWIVTRLKLQLAEYPNARNNKFVMAVETNQAVLNKLTSDELSAWEILKQGPIELDQAVNQGRNLAKSLAKLQRLGLAIYSGFTPTDAAHVLGLSDHLNSEAAVLAAKIWSHQMRCLYGIGRWKKDDAIAPSQQVYDLVIENINKSLIEACLHQSGKLSQAKARQLTRLLSGLILSSSDSSEKLFELNFCADYPIVAVGAPAASYYPAAAKALGVALHLPKHAEVASAVGAVMGSVIQRAHVTVSQPSYGLYRLYWNQTPQQFNDLDEALATAVELAKAAAIRLASAAGAIDIEVSISKTNNQVKHDIDGELFLDCRVSATAIGRPDCQKLVLN
ncbi:MAG: hypothetical protein OFPII_26640 [Osedax symbiont Rs1]|nr:MAG: hypothetical protein OFPII_26640 [Osedax symbiont Rs1]